MGQFKMIFHALQNGEKIGPLAPVSSEKEQCVFSHVISIGHML